LLQRVFSAFVAIIILIIILLSPTYIFNVALFIVTAIAIDKDNTKWFGTWFLGGVVAFDNQNWTYFDPSHFSYPEFYQYISSIAVDQKNVKWIAALGGGLIKYDGITWTLYNTANSDLPDNYIKTIVVDKQDNKWIGTSSGLVKYDDKVWTIYNTSNSGIPGNNIASIAIDHEGNKWIACNGLTKYDDKTWTLYNTSNSGLPENDVTAIAIDQQDNKWMGTFSKGLSKFDNKKWMTYDSSNSPLSGSYISSIAIDSLGNKWIGVHDYYESHGGLAKLDSTNWKIFNASNSGLPHDDVYSVIADQKGNIWIGTYKGLAVFREDGILLDNLPNIPVLISVKNNAKDQPLSITLQWEKAAMADSYHLQLANDSLFKTIVLNDSLITSSSRTITNLLEGRIYFWRLKAKNNLGESKWSNPWNFTTVLYAPDSLKVKVLSAKEFQLSWIDRSGEENGFIIERREQSAFDILDTIHANSTSYIDSTIKQQTFYEYRVKAYNKYAVSSYSNTASIAATGVNNSGTIPTEYSLSQNYPNPFNPSTLIRYGLPKESFVRIVIYNSLGQMVRELILANQYAGFHEFIFKAGNMASGVYFYFLEAKAIDGSKDYREIRKMMLVK
jgi:sugar lactone lactonase YvrE